MDEWLLSPLKEAEARDVLELVEARNKVASTIFCSQYDTSEWHENLYAPSLADAICDRIIYNAYTIQIEGESKMIMKIANALSISPAELINIPEINDYLKDGDPDNDSPPDSE